MRYDAPLDFRGRNLYSLGPFNQVHEDARREDTHGEGLHVSGCTVLLRCAPLAELHRERQAKF